MPSFLKIQGFVFDTQALKDAYLAVPPAARSSNTGYDEAALEALIRYFADWWPSREESLMASPGETLESLSGDEKRELYNEFTKQLARNLEEQYSRDIDQEKFEGFLHRITQQPLPKPLGTFFLRWLWRFSKQLHEYDQTLFSDTDQVESPGESEIDSPDAVGLIPAIHRLPGEYLETKHAQYEGDIKVNQIRFSALEQIRKQGSLSESDLQTFVDEENSKYDTDIMRAFDSFSVLGQLYFDYFRPRVSAYLDDITSALIEEVGIDESTAHVVDFLAPRNILSDDAWFAIYPESRGSKGNAYQLFMGIQWDGVRYGLYVGDDLREDGWQDRVDIDTITETDALTLDLLIDKFDEVLPEYYRLNEIQSVDPPERPPDDVVETVTRQLESAKQVVFYGPPGTGKTFEAKRFAEWWVFDQSDGKPRDEQVESVTFHPSFSYEDFIEGLTAEATEEGDVQYQIEDGVLKRVAERAQRAYDQTQDSKSDSDGFGGSREAPPYVLIIDEINRGNLAQIFGEVITLLEADKRGSFEISLAHSGEQFSLPPNLYVIGTMNTADQSIALVDTALRRRFRFVDFPPNLDVIWQEYQVEARTPTDAVTQPGAAGSRREQLLGASVEAISELNTRILHAPELGKGKQLGHTYLLGHDSAIDVVDAWRYDILPQLEEYYFGQFDRLQNDLLTETGDRLIDWETEQIRSFNAESLYTALCQIARINDPVPLVDGAEVVVSDGDGTSLEAQDSWAAGEKTKEAFRERIQRNLNQQAAERVERLLDVGEDLGWVDTGRGDQYPTAQLKTDDIDPGVGVIQINQDGEMDFRWDWLSGREENSLTPEFIDEAASVFDVIDGYEHTWNPDEEEFESPTLDVAMLSDEEMDALVEGIQSFAQRAANHDE